MGQIYKYHKSRDIKGEIKTVTIKRDPLGDIYIYFACKKEESLILPRTGNSVGFDFGLKTFLTASGENQSEEAPLFLKQGSKQIAKLNRALSSKKKSSNNRKRAKLNLARAHRKIANQRKDYHFQLASRLAGKYATICVETLNIKAMQRMWGRKISDLGHSQFIAILKHQCTKTDSVVVEIPAFYPSSKTCFHCGHILSDLPLRIREWTCPNCNTTLNRDKNAANNIHRVGTSALRREDIRPA